jgi:MFS transporter, DHA1 family, multidrug resistance protein
MDSVDKELEGAELDANLREQSSRSNRQEKLKEISTGEQIDDHVDDLTGFSQSHTDSENSTAVLGTAMQQISTGRDDLPDVEKHNTAVSRIQTHRSQHSRTVGAPVGTFPSKKLLPPMGAGKPYPAPLPTQEEYVVEFDGADDPIHAQNWSVSRK